MDPRNARLNWATHRVLDSIHLLKVQITLDHNRQAHRQRAPDGSDPGARPSDPDASSRHSEQAPEDGGPAQSQNFQRCIGWQERLFSHTEVKAVRSSLDLGQSPGVSAANAERIRRLIDENPNYTGDEIFTRVVADKYIDASEIDGPFGRVGERAPIALAHAVLEGEGADELVSIVHNPGQTMHFFASLLCNDGSYHEELLGLIRFYPGGRLEVRPQFSNKTDPPTQYRLFTPSQELVIYTFDICEERAEEQSTFERTLIGDIKRQRARFDAGPSPDCELAMAPYPPHAIRMFYRGEIATARIYDWGSVAIDYQVKLPPKWTLDAGPEQVVGSSQIAVCRADGIAYINMPLEFTAVCENQLAPMLEVCLHTYTSSRARVVIGYGTCALPLDRGCHEITFDTWRVRGSVMDELRLQFLDSGLEIQPSVEQGISSLMDSDESIVVQNRFGLRTTGTGKVTVKINLAQQSAMFKKQVDSSPLTQLGSIVIPREHQSQVSSLLRSGGV
jgi:Meckel syndrome type 1 protein